MKLRLAKKFIAAVGVTGLALSGLAQNQSPLGKIPLFFEANHGQAAASAPFLARTAEAQCAISATGMAMDLRRASGQSASLKMNFVGADASAQVLGETELPGKVNYLVGSDQSRWQSGVPTFAQVRVEKIYPGVDVVFYGNDRQLEYDFNLAAGVNPAVVALRFDGAEKIQIDAGGELVISVGKGEIRQPRPFIYQTINGTRVPVAGGYQLLAGQTVAFHVGEYNHALPLVIDPVLNYSTFLGGNFGETAWAVAVNQADGSVFVAGQTLSTAQLAKPGAFQPANRGGKPAGDAFIARLDATGTNLTYLTYLGGSANDAAYGLAVDDAGYAYVCGATESADYPVKNSIADGGKIHGKLDSLLKVYPSDGFVAKLDTNGANLVYSSYLGGESFDSAYGIAVDGAGNAFITGFTYSSKFPVTPGAYQPHIGRTNSSYAYYCNAFITKLAAGGTNLNYSSYLGGKNLDVGRAVSCKGGNVFIAGYTTSTNFPKVNPIAGYTKLNGSSGSANIAYDAFVAGFTNSGTNLTLLYSTLLGGANNDQAFGIAADGHGNAYVVGSTASAGFPNTNNYAATVTDTNLTSFLRTNKNTAIHSTNAFLTQIKWNTNATASIGYSTVFGGKNADVAYAVAVANNGNVFVAGQNTSTNFPIVNSSGGLRTTNSGKSDAFVLAISNNAASALYSVRLGGRDNDRAYGIAVDLDGSAYVVGQTFSTNFPTLNARQKTRVGSNDCFLVKISLSTNLVVSRTPLLTIVPKAGITASAGAKNTASAADATSSLTLQWQMFPADYILECSGNFADEKSWVPVTEPVVGNGGSYEVTVPATNGSQFFRLRRK